MKKMLALTRHEAEILNWTDAVSFDASIGLDTAHFRLTGPGGRAISTPSLCGSERLNGLATLAMVLGIVPEGARVPITTHPRDGWRVATIHVGDRDLATILVERGFAVWQGN